MKFSEVRKNDDLKEFTLKNKNNFSLNIKKFTISYVHNYNNDIDKNIDFFVELSINDLQHEFMINYLDLKDIDYIIYSLFRKSLNYNDTPHTGIYQHFYNLINKSLISNISKNLKKKIKNIKRTKSFLKQKEDIIVSQIEKTIETDFNRACINLIKFGYNEEDVEKLFIKLVNRIRMKKVLE